MKRYIEFDGLRGWLALWVVLAHMCSWCGFGAGQGPAKWVMLWHGFTSADAAVEIFIILSGFAIHTLLLREPRPYLAYLTGRFFRIYPVYLLALLLSLALAPEAIRLVPALPWADDFYLRRMESVNQALSADPANHALWHATMLHGVVPKPLLDQAATTVLKPAWSISLEWQFYLAAPLIAFLLRRPWGLLLLWFAAGFGHVSRDLWENPDNAFLLRWLPMFLLGIGSAEFAARCERDENLAPRAGPWLVGLGVGSALLLCNRPFPVSLWILVWSMSIGAWRDFVPGLGSLLGRLMRLPPLQRLGAMSYPLYLLHWPFIVGLLALLQRLKPDLQPRDTLAAMLLSGLPLLLGISWVVHVGLEKPMMRLGRRITRRDAGAPSPAMPAPAQT